MLIDAFFIVAARSFLRAPRIRGLHVKMNLRHMFGVVEGSRRGCDRGDLWRLVVKGHRVAQAAAGDKVERGGQRNVDDGEPGREEVHAVLEAGLRYGKKMVVGAFFIVAARSFSRVAIAIRGLHVKMNLRPHFWRCRREAVRSLILAPWRERVRAVLDQRRAVQLRVPAHVQ